MKLFLSALIAALVLTPFLVLGLQTPLGRALVVYAIWMLT